MKFFSSLLRFNLWVYLKTDKLTLLTYGPLGPSFTSCHWSGGLVVLETHDLEPDLSTVNSDSWHRCFISVLNVIKIRFLLFKKAQWASWMHEWTNEQTNQQTCLITIPPGADNNLLSPSCNNVSQWRTIDINNLYHNFNPYPHWPKVRANQSAFKLQRLHSPDSR